MRRRFIVFCACALCAFLPQSVFAAGNSFIMKNGALAPVNGRFEDVASTSSPSSAEPSANMPASAMSGPPDLVFLTRQSLASGSTLSFGVQNPEAVRTKGELTAYAAEGMQGDSRIVNLALSSNSMALTYLMPAKLFGVLIILAPLHMEVDSTGAVAFSTPWYGSLLTFAVSSLKNNLSQAVSGTLAEGKIEENGQVSLSPELQAELFNEVREIFENGA